MRRLIGLGFDFLHFGRWRALPEIRCRATTTKPRTEILSKTSVVRLSWSGYIGTIEIETTSTTTVLTRKSRRGLVVRLLEVVSRLAAGWVRFFCMGSFSEGGMTFYFAGTSTMYYRSTRKPCWFFESEQDGVHDLESKDYSPLIAMNTEEGPYANWDLRISKLKLHTLWDLCA